ncbi:MAG: 1,3-beta-galactosyl-N-acetylhexosamine phosphorylase [Clostridia bacterium]|nr:1,3-beta-galactosyl-N-acetylhexosamine phosphorylase [Clostridia bacterium]
MKRADFTLPGEAGYEALTLELARRWGADVIRDSDGTRLSPEITEAGYRIYSTICIIRQHNAFAEKHPDAQQQTFLCSKAVTAEGETVSIPLMDGYFAEQLVLNDTPDALRYMQVIDRTENAEVPREDWTYENGVVTVSAARPWHQYTASFLAWRVWEEINMYNHTTNSWTSEHLRQLDPRHPEAWQYLQDWMDRWCIENPQTNVVRLTSLFYNFVWIWGADLRNRHLFTDWASYDFTVSPAALDAFREKYGYALTAEDFVNGGKHQVTHMPPTPAKRDYMAFIQEFVAEKAKVLVDIIHKHGKQAYVFYDDSWVGMEPCGKRFASVGFDGLIKCVFSGFECRLCAYADVPVHELRFHPYLFPTGLGGQPTFSEGGEPDKDALRYWRSVRRALLREPVDRIGLGGYLSLTIPFPKFHDAIEAISDEFRRIKAFHANGAPYVLPCRVAVLHTWGSLRSWTLSGHFHETDKHALIHINEALSGLPVDVKFISFEDVKNGALADADVVINAGRMGDAWSGGDAWKDAALVAELTRFVHEGGAFIGVGEPSAVPGYDRTLRMAHVLGVDIDKGERVCHGRWQFSVEQDDAIAVCESALGDNPHVYLTDGTAKVLCARNGAPQMTLRSFGRGKAVYMSHFTVSQESTRMLLETLLACCNLSRESAYLSDSALVETAWYPADRVLVALNNAEAETTARIHTPDGGLQVTLSPLETRMIQL